MLRFEWDEHKNKSNRSKHVVWFEEAQGIFDDPGALRYFDPEHSDDEDRFILLVIRIISARKATKKEVKVYEEGI